MTNAERKRRYRERHPERVAAANRRWRQENPDKKRAANASWRERNPGIRVTPEQAAFYSARWYAQNKERRNAAAAKWRSEHPEQQAEYRRRRRSRRMGTDPDFTVDQWAELLDEFDYACAYCQARDVALEREHLTPLARGGRHTKANIVPACRRCNAKKGKKTMLEFLTVAA